MKRLFRAFMALAAIQLAITPGAGAQSRSSASFIAERKTDATADEVRSCADRELQPHREIVRVPFTERTVTDQYGRVLERQTTSTPVVLNSFRSEVASDSTGTTLRIEATSRRTEGAGRTASSRPIRVTAEARRIAERVAETCAP